MEPRRAIPTEEPRALRSAPRKLVAAPRDPRTDPVRALDDFVALRVSEAARAWSLSARQQEVLGWVARGASNKEAAAALGCAEVTVEKHLTKIFRASGVDGRGRLMAAVLTTSITRGGATAD